MPTYVWVGRGQGGVAQRGERVANSKAVLIDNLRKEHILVTSVQEKKGGFSLATLSAAFERVSDKDLTVFTRQFATMIDAGLPLVQCLDILEKQSPNPLLRRTLGVVRIDVEGGTTYADALKKHPKVFSDLYVAMVAAGETGGILDVILHRLAAQTEKAMKLKRQIKGAMVYPGVVLTVAIVVIVVLLIFVIPIFAQMFTDYGGALPALTQLVINVSNLTKDYFFYIIGGVVALGFMFRRYYKTETGRKVIDRLALKLPVIGDLIRKSSVAQMTRTLGSMLSSGVPILQGLEVVAGTTGNKIISMALMEVRKSISEGKTIAEPLRKEKVFPDMVVQMIGVGEATGSLDAMLSKIADFYEDEVDVAVTALTSLLEPLLIIFLGITIGTVVIAMYLPIFKLASVIQ